MRPALRSCLAVVVMGSSLFGVSIRSAGADPTPGFLETWSSTTMDWGGGSSVTNPGTGGVGGFGDGFLLVATPTVGNLGTRSIGGPYPGNWMTAGITYVRFALLDVGSDEPLEIHFSIGYGTNLWQSTAGFSPPGNGWGEFSIDLIAANFTQIIGTGTFEDALQTVDRIHFRHDLPPFAQAPDLIQGDFGLDHLFLGNEMTPALSMTWGRIKSLYQ